MEQRELVYLGKYALLSGNIAQDHTHVAQKFNSRGIREGRGTQTKGSVDLEPKGGAPLSVSEFASQMVDNVEGTIGWAEKAATSDMGVITEGVMEILQSLECKCLLSPRRHEFNVEGSVLPSLSQPNLREG